MASKILKRPAVEAATGLRRSTLYRLISLDMFPPPVRIGLRAVGWREDQINSWIEQRRPVRSGQDAGE